MISLEDCDRLYPSVHDTAPGDDADAVDTSKKPYLANHSMLSLTIPLGKVMKLLYSATGILNVTDQQLEQVELELDQYVAPLGKQLGCYCALRTPPADITVC